MSLKLVYLLRGVMVLLISIERAYDKKLGSVHFFFFPSVFPGGPVVKNPPCNAEETGFNFWSGKIIHAAGLLSPCSGA